MSRRAIAENAEYLGTFPIGPITDDEATTIDIPDRPAGKTMAISHLHLVNESESVRTRVTLLARGQSDTELGHTACGFGDAGADVSMNDQSVLMFAPDEDFGLQCGTTGASIVGFCAVWVW